jgi:RING-box protein 1
MNSQFLVAKNRFVKRINKNTQFNDLVKIKNIHIRGYWRWDIHNDVCAICRNYIFEPSINSSCQECSAVVGTCGHAYHYECISSWLRTKKNCPLCNSKWSFKNTNDEPIVYTNTSNIEESMSDD